MTRRLALAPIAERDLIDIWSDIAADSPSAADRYLDLLRSKTELLLEYPGIGRPWRKSGGRRICLAGRHLIIYRDTPEGVLILRYVHGRRDLTTIA